ncbi:MAG: hypothetical protein HKL96_12635 [Phycisphaerales bacterium]|nr:hypothetical protein [Phycisphaerales bacterium]
MLTPLKYRRLALAACITAVMSGAIGIATALAAAPGNQIVLTPSHPKATSTAPTAAPPIKVNISTLVAPLPATVNTSTIVAPLPAPATAPAATQHLPPQNNPARQKHIQKLIHALLSDRYEVRHAAATKLLALGDIALPAMKTALQGLTTPEMRHLLRQNIREITQADLLRGPLITLNLKNVSVNEALKAICKQAGSHISYMQPNSAGTVSLSVVKQPFWKVIQTIAESTGVSPMMGYYNNTPGIAFGPSGLLQKGDFATFDGLFAVTFQSLIMQRTIAFNGANPQRNNSFTASMDMLAIPGMVGPLQVQQPVISKATDNKGNSLISHNPINQWWQQQGYISAVTNTTAQLQWPKHHGTSIRELKGYIPVMASMHQKVITLTLNKKGKAHAIVGGFTVSINNLHKVGNMWQYQYVVQTRYGSNNLSPALQNMANQLENFNAIQCYSATGALLPYGGGGGGGNQARYALQENVQNGKPAKFVLTVYLEQQNFQVKFDFKNVPMP